MFSVRFFALALSLWPVVGLSTEAPLWGIVRDSTGGVVAEAEVSLFTPQQVSIATGFTDGQGRFSFAEVPAGSYLLVVYAPGFATRRIPIVARPSDPHPLTVTLELRLLHDQVTITAELGSAEDSEGVVQPVNVIQEERIRERAGAVVGQIANEEVGVHLQRTSPTIAGIYVRGLTGNKVNVFVDGVRYSNSAARGGINTFLDLIEPSNLQTVEILRGPNSAQYGSDALGGSIQFLSRLPAFAPGGKPVVRGSLDTLFNSADASLASNLLSSFALRDFALLANVSGRRASRLRTGGGLDSHSAVTRFLGLRSDLLLGGRLPDTAFTQYGGMIKLNWAPSPRSQISAHYSRGQIDGGKRHDQLLGGDGNLVADLRNLMNDLAYVRYSRFRLGWFDHFSATYSFNSQREERVNQGGSGNPRASINHEYERMNVHGIQVQARKQWTGRQNLLVGGEYYHERMHSPSFGVNPAAGIASPRRPRVPDRARYDSGGLYLQNTLEAIQNRLRLVAGIRYGAAAYRARAQDSPMLGEAGLWPDDSLRVSDWTYRGGVVATLLPGLNLFSSVSRGFRAPHMTDLGTFGLTGSGFEVAAPELAGLGAAVGSTAGTDAVSTGRAVDQVRPESSLNYEAGARFRSGRIATEVAFFVNNIRDGITKQALILPPGAAGLVLAGQTITAQSAGGAVFVPAAANPVLVRVNYDDARIHGIEHSLSFRIRENLLMSTNLSYLRARDTLTGLPPNIEGGIPAPGGYLKIRYHMRSGRLWLEPYFHAAGRQDRLSSLDLQDRRTGAARSRSGIRDFFLRGATVRGFVEPGPDGAYGTADDRLRATGETLAQVQDRVLGPGVAAGPLFSAVPGFVTLNLRAGLRLNERQDLLLDFSNVGDTNYRGISWGIDAPGRSLALRYRISW